MKYRRPDDLYLRWTDEAHSGREAIYRKDWNGGRLRVNPGSLLPNVNLDPLGGIAMADSRHPIREHLEEYLVAWNGLRNSLEAARKVE